MIQKLLLCLGLVGAAPAAIFAQTDPGITVTRDSGTALIVHHEDWSACRRVDVQAREKDGSLHTFSGIAVSDLLRKAGVPMGNQLRGPNMAQYLVVKAADGYKVLFALPELDSAFSDRTVILADQMDGQPLIPSRGPYRIVVPGEKKPARWIFQVRSLEVHKANDN
jgi:hypothetical protein